MVAPFPRIPSDFEEDAPAAPYNAVSRATVGQDDSDPSRAFMYVDNSGQVLVECILEPDGDFVQAYLCLEQSGPNAGGFIPVSAGDAVIIAWPDGDGSDPYIIGRCNNTADPLASTVAGIATRSPEGQVRMFRWLTTPAGQVYAVQPSGELLLVGGAAGVRIAGAQIVVDGPTHLGANFASAPVPGHVAGGAQETTPVPAGPFVPVLGATLTDPPFVGYADAIVRAKDTVQSNLTIDPAFWAWVKAVNVLLALVATALGLPWAYPEPAPGPPLKLNSQHQSASGRHTASD